ncbi:MAG TPA: helix-turn-helix domain-containing protein [Gemmataceae bacterium]|nr:helix-turn-helix domain-containing protein [Gemmataceae bacterium]
MAAKSKGSPRRKIAGSYLKLDLIFPLVSIKSETQRFAAQAMIDQLLAKGKLHKSEESYLDALSNLVEAYEDVHFPIAPASDADMLRHLMEAKGITQAELHRQAGIPRSTISEILAGKKPFSRNVIRSLADLFQVDASVLASNL